MDLLNFIKQNNARIMADFKGYQPRYYQRSENNTSEQSDNNIQKTNLSLLMNTIYVNFNSPSHILQKKLDWGVEKFQKHCNELIKKELLQAFTINLTGKRGGTAKYFVLTEKGLKQFNLENYIPNARGGTSTIHTWLQKIAGIYLKEQNFKVNFEVNGNVEIDIVAASLEKQYAIEIVCSTDKHESEKLQKIDKLNSYEKVIFICINKARALGLKKQLQNIPVKTAWIAAPISELLQGRLLKEQENG